MDKDKKKAPKPPAPVKQPLGASVADAPPTKRNKKKPHVGDGITVQGHAKIEKPAEPAKKPEPKKAAAPEDKKGKGEQKKDDKKKGDAPAAAPKEKPQKKTADSADKKKGDGEKHESRGEKKPRGKKSDNGNNAKSNSGLNVADASNGLAAAQKQLADAVAATPTNTAEIAAAQANVEAWQAKLAKAATQAQPTTFVDPAIAQAVPAAGPSGDSVLPAPRSKGQQQQPRTWNKPPAAGIQLPATHGMKLLCVMHGQLRYVNHMNKRPDATYTCKPERTCKPEFAPSHLGGQQQQQQNQQQQRQHSNNNSQRQHNNGNQRQFNNNNQQRYNNNSNNGGQQQRQYNNNRPRRQNDNRNTAPASNPYDGVVEKKTHAGGFW